MLIVIELIVMLTFSLSFLIFVNKLSQAWHSQSIQKATSATHGTNDEANFDKLKIIKVILYSF